MTSKTFLLRWQIAFGLSFNFHNTCKVWTLVGTAFILSTSNLTLSWVKRTPSRYRINGSRHFYYWSLTIVPVPDSLLLPNHRIVVFFFLSNSSFWSQALYFSFLYFMLSSSCKQPSKRTNKHLLVILVPGISVSPKLGLPPWRPQSQSPTTHMPWCDGCTGYPGLQTPFPLCSLSCFWEYFQYEDISCIYQQSIQTELQRQESRTCEKDPS